MGLISKIFGSKEATSAISAVGGVLDDLFTSDDEKLTKAEAMQRLLQEPQKAQNRINEVEASHRSLMVAGWRPYIGWVCGTALAMYFIPQYAMGAYIWSKLVLATGEIVPYPVSVDGVMELVLAMLGMSSLRTFEKIKGKAK